jgi:hypothetical protein
LREPSEFKDGSFRRINQKTGDKTVNIIIGKLKGATKTTAQALRFNKDQWTADEAKKHCDNAGGKFEAAVAGKEWSEKMESQLQELISTALQAQMGEGWVEALFIDTAVFSTYRPGGNVMYEVPWSVADGEITLGEPKAVELDYVEKRMADELGPSLSAPIVFKNDEERIVYGPVLIPGKKDSDGEVVSKEKIREVAHEFMRSYRNQDIGHTLNNVATPVESYLTPMDMTLKNRKGEDRTLPEGTWMMGSYVENDIAWDGAKKGELNGFSVMGVREDALLGMAAKEATIAVKKVLLGDLGEGWKATHVALVRRPAVAEWLAVKEADDRGYLVRLFSRKEGKRYSDARFKTLKAAHDTLSAMLDEANAERNASKEDEMDKDEVLAAIKAANEELKTSIEEADKKITERLDALEAPKEEPAVKEEPISETPPEVEPDVEALKAQITELETGMAQIEAKLNVIPESKAVKGQDTAPNDDEKEPDYGNRNAMGVKSR